MKCSHAFSLNYANWDTFLQTISSRNDRFANRFKDASNWNLNESLNDLNIRIGEFNSILPFMEEGPGRRLVNEEIARLEERSKIVNARKCEEPEGDHFAIMKVVCEILGLAPKEENNYSLLSCIGNLFFACVGDLFFDNETSQRCKYFDLMRDSQFLQINCNSLDDFNYDPGVEAAKFIKEHPEVKAIALGCGKFVEEGTFSFCCHSKEMSIWHSKAMSIDIRPGSCDVITDMHDPRFWAGIEPESLEEISDHTNCGPDLFFRNLDTIKNIAKALMPNGKLTTVFGLTEENHKKVLHDAGFKAEDNHGKIWKKIS